MRLPVYPSHGSDRCVGGVQSFLITAVGYAERVFLRRAVYIAAVRQRLFALCRVSPSLNDSGGLGGVLGDIPLFGGRAVRYDALWRTSIPSRPNKADTAPVASGCCAKNVPPRSALNGYGALSLTRKHDQISGKNKNKIVFIFAQSRF